MTVKISKKDQIIRMVSILGYLISDTRTLDVTYAHIISGLHKLNRPQLDALHAKLITLRMAQEKDQTRFNLITNYINETQQSIKNAMQKGQPNSEQRTYYSGQQSLLNGLKTLMER